MKRVWPVALALLAAVAVGYYADRSFNDRLAIKKAQADYAEAKKVYEADKELSLARIDELTSTVSHMTNAAAQYEAQAAQDQAQIASQADTIAALQAAEPPTTPEVESLPIVINLRAQVAAVTRAFNLSQNVVTTQGLEIKALKEKCVALEAIGDEWKAQAQREYALRVAAEGLAETAIKHRKTSKYLSYAGAGLAFVFGYLAGR
jgi:hypothetical protein